jgi:hypothetical protein
VGALDPTDTTTDPDQQFLIRFARILIRLIKNMIRSAQTPIRIAKTADPGVATTDPAGNNRDLLFDIFDQGCYIVDRHFL